MKLLTWKQMRWFSSNFEWQKKMEFHFVHYIIDHIFWFLFFEFYTLRIQFACGSFGKCDYVHIIDSFEANHWGLWPSRTAPQMKEIFSNAKLMWKQANECKWKLSKRWSNRKKIIRFKIYLFTILLCNEYSRK